MIADPNTWPHAVAARNLPPSIFLHALTIAENTTDPATEAHPVIVTLCRWWNERRYSKVPSGLWTFSIFDPSTEQVHLAGREFDTLPDAGGWQWLRDSRESQAFVGEHVIVTFLDAQFEQAEPGGDRREPSLVSEWRPYVGTLRYEDRRANDRKSEAALTVDALRQLQARFPEIYRVLSLQASQGSLSG
jgi:hypothetical protein